MEWLNYHHLLYFWVVVKEGSIAGASRRLRVSAPTISEQLRLLEEHLGAPLLERNPRGIALTELGRTAFHYAEEIFALGGEFLSVARKHTGAAPRRLVVGLSDALPKTLVLRLLEPLLAATELLPLVCVEGRLHGLLDQLTTRALDVVLSEREGEPPSGRRVYATPLGQSALALLGVPALVEGLRGGLPRSLDGAPLLLPTEDAGIRRGIEAWFAAHSVAPRVLAEVGDSALLKSFAARGLGLAVVPSVVAEEVCQQYGLQVLTELDTLHERYFAYLATRRPEHPGVQKLLEHARREVFPQGTSPAHAPSPKRERGAPERAG